MTTGKERYWIYSDGQDEALETSSFQEARNFAEKRTKETGSPYYLYELIYYAEKDEAPVVWKKAVWEEIKK